MYCQIKENVSILRKCVHACACTSKYADISTFILHKYLVADSKSNSAAVGCAPSSSSNSPCSASVCVLGQITPIRCGSSSSISVCEAPCSAQRSCQVKYCSNVSHVNDAPVDGITQKQIMTRRIERLLSTETSAAVLEPKMTKRCSVSWQQR